MDNINILQYNSPVTEWIDGIPLGNGTTGAMLFGAPVREILALNHDRLWRNKYSKKIKTAHLIPVIRKLCLGGKTEIAEKILLDETKEGPDDVNSYQPFASLNIHIKGGGSYNSYSRKLDLGKGIASISYISEDVEYAYECFISEESNLLFLSISSGLPGQLSCSFEFSRIDDPECSIRTYSADGQLIFEGRFIEGVSFTAVADILTIGGEKYIKGKSEQEIYKELKLPWIPPELREEKLITDIPKLIELKDIKGDLHCHTNWSAGKDSIEKMYEKAMSLGYEYLGISDHTKFLRIENGLDEKRLLEQSEYIKKLKKKGYKILHGCETNILTDGSLDIKNEVLKELDYVIAGIHSGLHQDITQRIIKAMDNPYVKIISHLTGRLIQKREESLFNLEKILKTAKQTNTILEINAYPERLDIKAEYIKIAQDRGIKMVINSDAHEISQLENMKYGVFEARRGGLEKKDVLNTLSFKQITNYL